MDGFVESVNSIQPMGYRTDEVLPFAYSLARTFCVANRWFCSAPCQTYPNRRFLMAGTAYGDIATDTQSLQDPPPPNGTIFDRLHAYGIRRRSPPWPRSCRTPTASGETRRAHRTCTTGSRGLIRSSRRS